MKYIKKFIKFLTVLRIIIPLVYSICMKQRGIHWHFVGFDKTEQYDIIWKELHKAQMNYEKKLSELDK